MNTLHAVLSKTLHSEVAASKDMQAINYKQKGTSTHVHDVAKTQSASTLSTLQTVSTLQ